MVKVEGGELYTRVFPPNFSWLQHKLAIIAAFFIVDDNLFAELYVRTILLSPMSYIPAAKRLHSGSFLKSYILRSFLKSSVPSAEKYSESWLRSRKAVDSAGGGKGQMKDKTVQVLWGRLCFGEEAITLYLLVTATR